MVISEPGSPFEMSLTLKLLGLPTLVGLDGPLVGAPVQRHRVALLALLAEAPGHALSRDKLIGYLWPDTDSRQGRHLLNVAVHELRKALGKDVLLSVGDDLRLATQRLHVDVVEFEALVARGEPRNAVALYTAPFLDGFFLDGCEEFEKWADRERDRLALRYRELIARLAEDATSSDARVEAVNWWRHLVTSDPYNSRYVLRLMEALEAAGDRGNAIDVARTHEAVLARELGAEPELAIRQLVDRLRRTPAAVVPELTPAPPPSGAAALLEAREPEADRLSGLVDLPSRGAAAGLRRRLLIGSILAVGVAVGALALRTRKPRPDEGRVLVLPFTNETGEGTLDPLGGVLADRITEGLTRTALVDVVDFRATLAAIRQAQADSIVVASSPGIDRLARETRAARVLTGSYYLTGDSVVIRARLIDADDGRVLAALPDVAAPAREPMRAVEEVRARAMGALASLSNRRSGGGQPTAAGGPAPKYEAYLEYLEGLDGMTFWGRGGMLAGLPHFLRAASLDSSFATPLFWATYIVERCVRLGWSEQGETRCNRPQRDSLMRRLERVQPDLGPIERQGVRYLQARSRGDDAAAYAAAANASRLVPQSLWTAEAAQLANQQGRFEEVVRLLGGSGIGDGWAREMSATFLTQAYHLLGRYREELAVARATQAAFPDIWAYRAVELRARAALGQTDSVLAGLDGILTRWGPLRAADASQSLIRHLHGHGHPEASRAAAERCVEFFFADSANLATEYAYMGGVCLFWAGRYMEARAVFEQAAARSRQFQSSALAWLGVLAVRTEDPARAKHYLDRLAAPGDDSTNATLRARVAAALGDWELAVKLLRRVVATNPEWRFLHRDSPDPGWETIQNYPAYRTLIDKGH